MPTRLLTDDAAVHAWLRLIRVFLKVDRLTSARFRLSHLTAANFDILAHVAASEGITQQALADSLLVTKGNVCQVLDRMEREQLIERRQLGRSNSLYLTDTGRELVQRVMPDHEALLRRCFEVLSQEEQKTLLGLLRKVDRSLSDLTPALNPCDDGETRE